MSAVLSSGSGQCRSVCMVLGGENQDLGGRELRRIQRGPTRGDACHDACRQTVCGSEVVAGPL